jgi:hypothetical protein
MTCHDEKSGKEKDIPSQKRKIVGIFLYPTGITFYSPIKVVC